MSTVGPGKDYATLQAWSDATIFDLSNAAECFSGSDLGDLFVDNSFLTYVTESMLIFAATNEGHSGNDEGSVLTAATCGLIQVKAIQQLVVLGMRIRPAFGIGLEYWAQGSEGFAGSVSFFDNMIVVEGDAPTNAIYLYATDSGGFNVTLDGEAHNNIVYWKSTSGAGNGVNIEASQIDTGSVGVSVRCLNNTVIRSSGTMSSGYVATVAGSGTLDLMAINNIALSNSTCFSTVGVPSFTASDNLSTDATGDDWGATGAVINQTATDVVVDLATDATLKPGSGALNAGFNLSAYFSTDAIGVARPQGPAWDIGALELLGGGVGGRFRFFVEGGSQGNIIGA